MSRTDSGHGSPRAVIHRRILDVAESRPDASLEAIGDEVAGATTDLVEQVLDEYGDPAEITDSEQADSQDTDPEQADSEAVSAEEADSDGTAEGESDPGTTGTEDTQMKENGTQASETEVDPSSLSAKQRKTLRIVHDHPEWSQADVAERLDVSRATVSRRLNDIPGFEWGDRESFTRRSFDEDPGTGEPVEGAGTPEDPPRPEETDATEPDSDETGGVAPAVGNGGTVAVGEEATLDRVEGRLDRIESEIADPDGDGSVDLSADLAHKVVHASMNSDRITEDEELRLIEALFE